MKHLRKSLFIVLFILISISFLLTLSLQDNDNYKKALELLQMAKEEYDNGNYDKGYEYSEQSKEYMRLAEKEYYIEKLIEQVNKYGDIAEQRLIKADELGVAESEDENIKDLYEKAGTAYDEAAASFEQADQTEDIDQAIADFEKAGEKFEESAKYSGTILSELMPNPDRDDADDLLNQAFTKRDELLENGTIEENDEYDAVIMNALNKAIEYFDNERYVQSKENSSAALAYMDNMNNIIAKKEEAEKMLDKVEAALNKAEEENIDEDVLNNAGDTFNNAIVKYDDKDYDGSIDLSIKALNILGIIMDSLPKYYRVRLIPENRDCFWKIAQYYFIYQNKYNWRAIYEKNKQILRDPNNPNLIHPGQVFEIPSIKGEIRDGEFDPDQKYPNFNDVTK